MMGIRTIDAVEMSLEDMLEQGLISAEQAEAEESSREQMREHGTRLRELAGGIADPVLRWNILTGGR